MVQTLEEAINLTMQKYGYNSSQLPQLLNEVRRGNFGIITSENGARKYISSLTREQLEYELNNYGKPKNVINSLEEAINLTMQKYGYNSSQLPQLLNEVRRGNFGIITNMDGARDYISSLTREQLEYELNNYGKPKNVINSLEEAINLTMQKYGYNSSQLPQLLNEVRRGNFGIITSENGARAYVSSLSKEELDHQLGIKQNQFSNNNQSSLQSQELNDIDYVIDSIIETNNIDRKDPKLKEILTDQLINVFMGRMSYQVNGRDFTNEVLIQMMEKKCIEAAKEKYGNAGHLYQLNIDDYIDDFDQVAFLSTSYIDKPEVIRHAILTNPTFSGNIIGEIITQALNKKKNQNNNLGNTRNQMNQVINNVNLNCSQKSDMFFRQMIGQKSYYSDINPNTLEQLSELSPEKMKLVILINSINLNQLEMKKGQVDGELVSMYSGNNTLDNEQLKLLREKNNSILFELYNYYKKYGLDGISQYINGISIQDLAVLCNLYVNSNSNQRKQQLMDIAGTYCTNSEIVNLKIQLSNPDLLEKMSENKGKSY